MKCIKAYLPRELKSLELHTISDLHIGDKCCDMSKIGEIIDVLKENKNAYCILNGDILNNSTRTSVGDIYAETRSPMQQIEEGVELLSPIKHKIIAVTAGNHELRTYKNEGIDLSAIMAAELGLRDKYAAEGALIFLRFGQGAKQEHHSQNKRRLCYTIYATHGAGGGRKEGAKAIRLADMASIVDADIYIHSHTHLPMVMRQAYLRVDRQNNTAACVDKLFVNTAATLNYGGYGQRLEYKPSSKESPIIYISGQKRGFTAKL